MRSAFKSARSLFATFNSEPDSSEFTARGSQVALARPAPLHFLLFSSLYLLCAWLGHGFALIPSAGVTLWPPSGLFLAVLLLSERRDWPWFVLAGLPAEFVAGIWFYQFPLAASLPIYGGNALEAIFSAWLIRRWFGAPFQFTTLRAVFALTLIGCALGPALSATIGSLTLAGLGIHPFHLGWPLWWIGDASGVLIVAPLVLVAVDFRDARIPMSAARWVELCAGCIVFVAIAYLSLSGRFPFAYIVLPPLLWAALRFELVGAAVGSFVMALMTLVFTTAGVGPFASRFLPPEQLQLFVQLFLGIVPFSMLVVGALARQHRQAIDDLRAANEELEARVGERTAKLRESEERHRLALHAAAMGTFIWHVKEDRCEADARMLELFDQTQQSGLTLQNALATMIHPGDRDRYADAVRLACDPRGPGELREDIRVLRHGAAPRWVTVTGRTFFDDRMQPIRMAGTAVDITDRKVAEVALRASEDRLRMAQQAAAAGAWELDLESGEFLASDEALALYGLPAGSPMTQETALAATHPADRPLVEEALRRARQEGVPFRLEARAVQPDGSVRWLLSQADLRSAKGGSRLVGLVQDVTALKEAEMALRASEAAFRVMFSLSSVGKAELDAETGRFLRVNAALCALTGYAADELLKKTYTDIAVPIDPGREPQGINRLDSGEPSSLDVENQYARKDGTLVWARTTINVVRDESGRPLRKIAVIADLSESKMREQQVQFLMREVNHRAKNQLAVVQAIARLTAKSHSGDFLEQFDDRLRALAAGLDLLVRSEWKGIELADLVRSQLAHFQDLIGERIFIRGPSVVITAAASQTLGIALHELATNAGKYGALSSSGGSVDIDWRLDAGAEGDRRFSMAWTERGGPPVVAPARRGFGTTVMDDMVRIGLGANVVLDYAMTGLRWRFDCPASRILESEGNALVGLAGGHPA